MAGGRQVTGHQQCHAERDELALAEPVAVVPRGDKLAQQVAGLPAAALRHELGEVSVESLHHVVILVRGQLLDRDDAVGELPELAHSCLRNAQDLADHGNRQRQREALDQVGLRCAKTRA